MHLLDVTRNHRTLQKTKKLKFISITSTSTNASAIDLNNGAKEVFAAAGINDFVIQYYEQDDNTMIQMIENAISAGYNGMIIQSSNLEVGEETVEKALKAGMVVCEFDGDYQNIDCQYCFMGSNYDIGYAQGVMAGKWANENLVAKGITPIVGDIEYLVLDEFVKRAQGISDGLLATCPEAQMVVQGFELTMAENMSMVENWLQAHPDMNMVVGLGDTMTLGAAAAFKAAGKDPAVTATFGVDAIEESIRQIADPNEIHKGTIDLGLNQVGKTMAQFMMDWCNGVKVEGREKMNYFPITPVTIENVGDYTK